MPTIRPIFGPHIPAQLITKSVSMRPREAFTALTRPPSTSMPVTSVSPWKTAPRAVANRAIASHARTALAMPSEGTKKPP